MRRYHDDSDDDYEDDIGDDYADREGGPETEDHPDTQAVLGKIEEVSYIGWCTGAGAWDVDLFLLDGTEVTLTLDEGELRSLAAQEPLVAEEWDAQGGGLSDVQERAHERRQMGIEG